MRLRNDITDINPIQDDSYYMINDLIFTSAGELVFDHFEECLEEIVPMQDYDAE
jgi:hypothetical protein